MNLPIRLRLTLWYVALLAAALLLFAAGVYVLMSRSLVDNLDTSLQQRVNQLMPTLDLTQSGVQLPPADEAPDTPFIPDAILSPSGRPLSGRLPSSFSPWLLQHGVSLPQAFKAQTVAGFRIATAPIEGNNRQVGFLLVWQSMGAVDEARHSLLLLLLAIGPGLLLLTGVGGILLARRAFTPVAQITQTASRISATDLQRRVPMGRTRDELSELAATFNAMIERLEAAVAREREFTADASHELRSPLSVILAETSLALEQPLDSEEYRRALQIAHEQAATMSELISALLTLARVESIGEHREITDLAGVVDRATRQSALAMQEHGVQVDADVAPDLAIDGNETLLTRAVRNVLDNAIKASPHGGSVRVRASRDGQAVILSIHDDGPGIGREDQQRIFEPFYQVEKARTPGDSHGLGLAICRRIILAHGGEIAVDSTPGEGATFRIVLPAAISHSPTRSAARETIRARH